MLVDTHCHINMIVKGKWDTVLTPNELTYADDIISQAKQKGIAHIINVGTSLIESTNSVLLATHNRSVSAAVGIHPNDCSEQWKKDIVSLNQLVQNNKHLIVAIGEIGLDKHYPGYHMQRQQDAFKAQIELALEHDLTLIIHTRDAYDETLRLLEEFSDDIKRGVIHCFSEDYFFAQEVIKWGFMLGFGGTVTYPKNTLLREIVSRLSLEHIVLETDAPFLSPQSVRGTKNYPSNLAIIAEYIARLRGESQEGLAQTTTRNALKLFDINLEQKTET